MVEITYFVHSITTDNEAGIATGWLPGELSEIGRQKAVDLGHTAAGKQFGIVFCSDLDRAVETAKIVFGDTNDIILDSRLREINYGDMNGQPHSFKDTMDDFIDTPFPNGESYSNVETRLRSFCDSLRTKCNGERVAIVGHQAPQLALDVILKDLTWQEAIAQDWRKRKAWQPGWSYIIPD